MNPPIPKTSRASSSSFLLRACFVLLISNFALSSPRDDILNQTLHPYTGPSTPGVDPSTLHHKILCGYQGWHGAPGDGIDRGWYHWTSDGKLEPGDCKFDLWPDVSELDPDERYPTSFHHADGSPAELYSSWNRKTVLRHFQWMRQYNIDGVFAQRFIVETTHDKGLRQWNTVLDHVREGANLNGRTYALEYDLSGLPANSIDTVINDWKLLIDKMHLTSDPAYLHEQGKPVLAVWGFGFSDGRQYTLDEGLKLITFLKSDPRYGNNYIILGLPAHWRELNGDAVNDPKLHDLIALADCINPWTVGRYSTPAKAATFAQTVIAPDLAWCRDHHKDYLPVVFPGFSWHNMFPKSNLIPRLKGNFLWQQYLNLHNLNIDTAFQAMFDEVDEGTAIYKCTNDVPIGASPFLTYEGLPPDFYLRLVGQAQKLLNQQIPPDLNLPAQLVKNK